MLLIIFIISEVAGVPQIVKNVTFRSVYEVTFRLLELGAILWFPCILWNSTNPEQLWALNPKRLLKPISGRMDSYEYEQGSSDSSKTINFECWICYDSSNETELIRPCQCKVGHSLTPCKKIFLTTGKELNGSSLLINIQNYIFGFTTFPSCSKGLKFSKINRKITSPSLQKN